MTASTMQAPVLSPSNIVCVPHAHYTLFSNGPIVMAGLVPADLSDIHFSAPLDSAVTKKRTSI